MIRSSVKRAFESVMDDFRASQLESDLAVRNEELLEIYSLYKQGTAGDATGKRPGMLDMAGRAKFDAWSKRKGTSKDDAMQQYIDVVNRLMG